MFLSKNSTRSLEETIDELISQHEQLEKEAEALFEEMKMTPEQVNEALNDPDRFDEVTLKQLEKEKARQDQLFPSNRETIATPSPSQKRRALRQAANWIPMR